MANSSTFPSWNWPVRWELPVSIADSEGREPSAILEDPGLAAHRILDRLSSLAEKASRGGKVDRGAFANSVQEILGLAPWLEDLVHEYKIIADSQHFELAEATSDEPASPGQSLIDARGVALLLAVAAATSGKSGASLVLGLLITALASERTLKGLADPERSDQIRDLEALSTLFPGRASVGILEHMGRSNPPHVMSNGLLVLPLQQVVSAVQEYSIFGCISKIEQLIIDYSEPPPLPSSSPLTWTGGIESVSVTRPCQSPSGLILNGHGFGATRPSGVGIVVAVWDETLAEVVSKAVSIYSLSDTRISVRLPYGAVSGTVAFADLDWITRYNQWVDRENTRVQQIVENSECAGSKLPAGVQFRPYWSELPTPAAAASYKAGYAHISVEVSHVLGRFDGWWRGSILLQPGELFQIRWHSVNATEVSISADGASSAVLATALAAAGYSSTSFTRRPLLECAR